MLNQGIFAKEWNKTSDNLGKTCQKAQKSLRQFKLIGIMNAPCEFRITEFAKEHRKTLDSPRNEECSM